MSNLQEFRHEWIWEKDKGFSMGLVKREPVREHEHVLVFAKNKWKYNPIMQERKGSGKDRIKYGFNWSNKGQHEHGFKPHSGTASILRYPSSIQKFNNERGLHPTQKPVALFEYLIKTYSNEKDVILDCCAGSGTTAIACINTNRKYICMEKDEGYFKIMQDRISTQVKPLEVFSE